MPRAYPCPMNCGGTMARKDAKMCQRCYTKARGETPICTCGTDFADLCPVHCPGSLQDALLPFIGALATGFSRGYEAEGGDV